MIFERVSFHPFVGDDFTYRNRGNYYKVFSEYYYYYYYDDYYQEQY